jgi:hypothetical protein
MPQQQDYTRAAQLGDEIAEAPVRALYHRYLAAVEGLHDGVIVQSSSVEVRVSFQGHLLCRIVPYRELFHVQIGDTPAWESRIRSESGVCEAVDHTLSRFLRLAARRDDAGIPAPG